VNGCRIPAYPTVDTHLLIYRCNNESWFKLAQYSGAENAATANQVGVGHS
jgi:hypothetical protein